MKTIYTVIVTLALLLILPIATWSQTPEKQISFANESRPHTYYVQQAELWWKEVEKDKSSENNWYNYFRANRNAQGTVDWSTDFVKESPYLKSGEDIVDLMQKHIPHTFTYYYLSYLNGGIVPTNGPNLLKAYKMNPDFEGIHSSVITYAASILDTAMRKEVNKVWFTKNYISPQFMSYAYNALMSLDSNATLFTQSDNDTYPLWMLQDVFDIRPDVNVINIDFLLIESYRNAIFALLKVPPMKLEVKTVDDYHTNWEKVVGHALTHYTSPKPLYLGMTLFEHLYKDFSDHLVISGLAFQYQKNKIDLTERNKNLYENIFMLDYLKNQFAFDRNQTNINYHNLTYLNLFKSLYDSYKQTNQKEKAEEIKLLSLKIAHRIDNPEYFKLIQDGFQ